MITKFYVDNFRSLRNVSIELGGINFVCGPNGSGKTNLTEAFDFISNVFRSGLTFAVGEKGGFYNICFRRHKRSRSPIHFRINGRAPWKGLIPSTVITHCVFEIDFSLQTHGPAIKSDFYVESEVTKFSFRNTNNSEVGSLSIRRVGDAYSLEKSGDYKNTPLEVFVGLLDHVFQVSKPSPTELAFSSRSVDIFPFSVQEVLKSIRVFRISPRYAAQPGVPSISGELGKYGENLPSALNYIQTHYADAYKELEKWLREIIPDLTHLSTNYTESRHIGLYVHEKGPGLQWYAEELSDGTLMGIALFLAVLDPRHSFVLIEEPENSLHPWILKRFLECCRLQSAKKRVLITTQSPIVVAAAKPSDLYLIEKVVGRTQIVEAVEHEPNLDQIINRSYLDLGEYWLSGGLGAVPQAPNTDEDDLFR